MKNRIQLLQVQQSAFGAHNFSGMQVSVEAIAILLPIDRPLDTLRTVVNVEGDMVGCLVVQKFSVGKQ